MYDNERNSTETYFQGVKEYLMQIRSLYRIGVCFPSLLSPLSLIAPIADIYLFFGGGSILFLLLLCHYKRKTKMVCNKLICLAILNNLISITIILNFNKIQIWLCAITCLFAIYVTFEEEITKHLKYK